MAVHPQTKEERDKQNASLREHGFRWLKENNQWHLVDALGKIITLDAALELIASGAIKKPEPRFSTANRAAAIEWAHALVNRPQYARQVVVLDTETSGVDMTDVVLQIGIVNLRGEVLMDTLVYPDGTAISEKAQATHGISFDELNTAPAFPTLWEPSMVQWNEPLKSILAVSDIIIYNAPFDVRLLTQTANKYGLAMPELRTHCLMTQYSLFHGELLSAPFKPETYALPKLSAACEHFGIVPGTHKALDDAVAAKDVLLAMAKAYRE